MRDGGRNQSPYAVVCSSNLFGLDAYEAALRF
jgi:hypothetical protein